MSRRMLEVLGVAAVLIAVVLVLKFVRAPVDIRATALGGTLATPLGRARSAGHLDQETEEPLQRPARFNDREFFTDEERADLEQEHADIIGREADENRRQRGTEQDVSGAYNAAIFTSHLRVGRRTSMIVDPPDGRIPPSRRRSRRGAAKCESIRSLSCSPPRCARTSCPRVRAGSTARRPRDGHETPPYYLMDGDRRAAAAA